MLSHLPNNLLKCCLPGVTCFCQFWTPVSFLELLPWQLWYLWWWPRDHHSQHCWLWWVSVYPKIFVTSTSGQCLISGGVSYPILILLSTHFQTHHSWGKKGTKTLYYLLHRHVMHYSFLAFFSELSVTGSSDVWFINFYHPMCSHCHTLAPVWRRMARELVGVVRIGAVNCDDDYQLCSSQGIRSYPTLISYPGVGCSWASNICETTVLSLTPILSSLLRTLSVIKNKLMIFGQL